mmetsp:Transcript_7231/g.20554  ORF Transcript_7231/g.20554 Transcript_7231/m.20554 type:complete len:371 (-) Transcript_7231:70-1182(-)
MRAVLLLAACGAAASSAGLPPGACGASEECAFEESAMLQHRGAEAQAAFPDFGKIARSVTGAVDDVTAKANDLVGSALTTAGDTVNGTVAKVQASVDTYAARVNETAGSVRDGVAALLADAFKVNVPGLNVTQENKDLVLSLVGQADELVQTSLTSVTGTSSLLDALPKRVFNMTGRVNETFQAASTRCRAFSAAIKDVLRTLQDAANNFKDKRAAMLQKPLAAHRRLPHGDAADVVFSHAAMLEASAGEAPSAAMARLKGALTVAQDELKGFSDSFVASFESLSDSVVDYSKGALGEPAAAKVDEVFGGATNTARAVADHANVAFAQLLAGISEGANAAEAALPSAGHGLAPARGLVLAVAVVARIVAF